MEMVAYLFCETCGHLLPSFSIHAVCEECLAARLPRPHARKRIQKRKAAR